MGTKGTFNSVDLHLNIIDLSLQVTLCRLNVGEATLDLNRGFIERVNLALKGNSHVLLVNHFALENDSVILESLDTINDSLASSVLEVIEICLNRIDFGLEDVNVSLDVCLSALNVGDFNLDICRVALKLVHTILQVPSLALVSAKGSLNSVNLRLDIVNLLGKVVLRVSDVCYIDLERFSLLLKRVNVNSDCHSVILQLRKTAIKLISLIASIAVNTLESV